MMTEFTPDTIKIRQNMKKIEEKLEFTHKYLEQLSASNSEILLNEIMKSYSEPAELEHYLLWLFPQLKNVDEKLKSSLMDQAKGIASKAYGVNSKPLKISGEEADEFAQDFPTQDLKLVEITHKQRKHRHRHHHHHHHHNSNHSNNSYRLHDSPELRSSIKKIYKGEDSSGKGGEQVEDASPDQAESQIDSNYNAQRSGEENENRGILKKFSRYNPRTFASMVKDHADETGTHHTKISELPELTNITSDMNKDLEHERAVDEADSKELRFGDTSKHSRRQSQ